MEDYKGSHVLLFDLNDSQASSSPCSDHEDQAQEGHPREVDDLEDESYKWMPSKMRILRKMMMSSYQESSQKSEEQKQFLSTNRRAGYRDTISDSVRVCANCNTTKTPLWRSGPRGPKSLCNACGIRQRKARRAMAAAAAAAADGAILPETPPPPMKIKLKHKKKRSKVLLLHDPPLKRPRKSSPTPSPPSKKGLVGFEDFTSRVLSKHYYAEVFPQDEKEAAILLMALSCGLVCR